MRPRIFAPIALLLVLLSVPAFAESRFALVFGNGKYSSVVELPNPPNDAHDISASMRRLGFSVTTAIDADFDTMRRKLKDFGEQASAADIAVIFFAGHGMEIGGENWLIPIDAKLRSDTVSDGEAIALRLAMQRVASAKKLGLVILDACRNNPFAATMERNIRVRGVDRGFIRTEPTENVLVAYAARDGTTANDGDGRNSPFTAALLKNMETPGLEIRFLFANVHDDVMIATQREQQPFVYGSLSKDMIFLKPPPAAPPPPTSGPAPDQIAWSYLRDTTSVAALRRFIAEYPSSVRAGEARALIATLEKPVKTVELNSGAVSGPGLQGSSLEITITEGQTSEQISKILQDNPNLSGTLKELPPEGTLLPGSYKFWWGTPRDQMVQMMQQAQKQALALIWERRNPNLPLQTPEQLVTLASIVERENGKIEERNRIAVVYLNRLRVKMKLQSDPTIVYGLVGGKGMLGRPIRRSEILQPTPYNTYVIDGLPPGPICNPSRVSLEAAANPPGNRYLFFAADGTGGHLFSETYEQHRQSIAKLREVEKLQNNSTTTVQ